MVIPTKYKKTSKNPRLYKGHALDRMQERGIPISVVEHVIKQAQKDKKSKKPDSKKSTKTEYFRNFEKNTIDRVLYHDKEWKICCFK